MELVRRFRIPALFCAFAVLVCELVARPYTTMGVVDDGPYILMARTLADTGHIVYNGWTAAMIVSQLYLGAAFIKLFGFSFTTVRMSTLLVAMALAFLLQRTLVRTGINERNATLGTLALVLSPLYLMLSVTFMSDIMGLFAIVICLYACLRALQSTTDRTAIAYLCFAIATNVLFGTSRQIAWLGTLVMVPSTLWLLRSQRRVLIAGSAATLAGALSIFACMQWLKHQPYVTLVHLRMSVFLSRTPVVQLAYLLLDVPFLLLPVFALFLPHIRKARPRVIAILSALLLGLLFLSFYPSRLRDHFSRLLEPTGMYAGNLVGTHGFDGTLLLHPGAQVLLTIVCYGGLIGLIISLPKIKAMSRGTPSFCDRSWKQLGILLVPFTLAYTLLLLSAAATTYRIYDRYALGLLIVALPCLMRYYQERIQPQVPLMAAIPLILMAIYGIVITHENFAFDRARVALAAELAANGVPATSFDNGWEFNVDTELQHADHINQPLIEIPANGYKPVNPPPPGPCELLGYDRTPHIHPLYGVSIDPNACYGPAPFAPVHYSRWPYRTPGTLYVVRYVSPSKD